MFISAGALGFAALAIRSVCDVAGSLRCNTVAASARAYQSSKLAFLAVLAVIAALFLLHIIPTYSGMIVLFLVNLMCWRATAVYTLGRRDTIAGVENIM